MLIGRQEDTGYGSRIDLLAIKPDATLVLIELKRDRTPRVVVAQALDYASCVEGLRPEDVAAIDGRFAPWGSLAEDFEARFGQDLDEDADNEAHEIVIVASSLDESTERIVGYLNARDIAINVLFSQVFAHGADQLLSRAWLLDPVPVQAPKVIGGGGPGEPWNGEFSGSFGAGPERSWEEARRPGFFSAGGGTWDTQTLKLLKPGPPHGSRSPIGVRRRRPRRRPRHACPRVHGADARRGASCARCGQRGSYHCDQADDPRKRESFVPMPWLETGTIAEAADEIGQFGNPIPVCEPTVPKRGSIVERLKQRFPKSDAPLRL